MFKDFISILSLILAVAFVSILICWFLTIITGFNWLQYANGMYTIILGSIAIILYKKYL